MESITLIDPVVDDSAKLSQLTGGEVGAVTLSFFAQFSRISAPSLLEILQISQAGYAHKSLSLFGLGAIDVLLFRRRITTTGRIVGKRAKSPHHANQRRQGCSGSSVGNDD